MVQYLRDQPGPGSEIHLLQEHHSCQAVRPQLCMIMAVNAGYSARSITDTFYVCTCLCLCSLVSRVCVFLPPFSSSLYINLFGLLSILWCSVFAGMCLYSVYMNCDPWSAGLVSAPDQVLYVEPDTKLYTHCVYYYVWYQEIFLMLKPICMNMHR